MSLEAMGLGPRRRGGTGAAHGGVQTLACLISSPAPRLVLGSAQSWGSNPGVFS